jgi:hypothetical protein
MNKEWLAWLVFGLCVAALGLAHYWGLKRRAASMKKFAEKARDVICGLVANSFELSALGQRIEECDIRKPERPQSLYR